jgi:hypothetical protein
MWFDCSINTWFTYIEYRDKNNPSGYSFDKNATQIEIITCVSQSELKFSKIELD